MATLATGEVTQPASAGYWGEKNRAEAVQDEAWAANELRRELSWD